MRLVGIYHWKTLIILPDVFAEFIHRHDKNTVSRDVITTSYTIILVGVAASPSAYSLRIRWRVFLEKRTRVPIQTARKMCGRIGFVGTGEGTEGRETALYPSWNLGKEYVHFTEDGFRDNRAGACCVQKARSYANVPNVWNDATILRETCTCIRVYTHRKMYLYSRAASHAFAQVRRRANLKRLLKERERNKQKKRKGKGDRFEEEGPLSDLTAQSRHSTQIIYKRAWAFLSIASISFLSTINEFKTCVLIFDKIGIKNFFSVIFPSI